MSSKELIENTDSMLAQLTWKQILLYAFIAYSLYCWVMTRLVLRERINLVYMQSKDGKDTTITKILKASSKLVKMEYIPYMYAWNHYLQHICFIPYTIFQEDCPLFFLKFEKELFHFKDGDNIYL